MKLCRCRLQYYRTDQTCSHNQDSIEICPAQQAGTDEELLYTESWCLRCMSAGMLAELAWAAILNLLLHAGHISQCADHTIMMCHMKTVCLT